MRLTTSFDFPPIKKRRSDELVLVITLSGYTAVRFVIPSFTATVESPFKFSSPPYLNILLSHSNTGSSLKTERGFNVTHEKEVRGRDDLNEANELEIPSA